MKKGNIRCVDCRQEAPPSKKDSIYCTPCRDKLYARLDAATGEDIDGIALLDKMWRDNLNPTPAETARGDAERMNVGDHFEVRRG